LIKKWKYNYILKIKTGYIFVIYEWILINKPDSPLGKNMAKTHNIPGSFDLEGEQMFIFKIT
jgi:hypothetical protein